MRDGAAKRRTRQDSRHEEETHLLREVMRTQQAVVAIFSRELGLPAARLAILRELAVSADADLGGSKLARRLGVDPAAVTRQLNEMEDSGLVRRRPDRRDGRRSVLSLSAKGVREFERIHVRVHEIERALAARVGEAEVRTAVRVLAAFRGVLDEVREEGTR